MIPIVLRAHVWAQWLDKTPSLGGVVKGQGLCSPFARALACRVDIVSLLGSPEALRLIFIYDTPSLRARLWHPQGGKWHVATLPTRGPPREHSFCSHFEFLLPLGTFKTVLVLWQCCPHMGSKTTACGGVSI